MTPMKFLPKRLAWSLWVIPILAAGCTSTGQSRYAINPKAQSIAVVGDRPVAVASGEPGAQVIAEADRDPKLDPKARISGRVVDENGEPVRGVTVRLADSGTKVGKEIQSVTDGRGGFTLNGLRPGSEYALVAEYEDEKANVMLGRARARTAETDVQIALASEEAPARSNRTPAKSPRSRAVSNRTEVDEPVEPSRSGSNDEDLPATGESDSVDPGPSISRRPELGLPEAGNRWQTREVRQPVSRGESDADDQNETGADEPAPRVSRSSTSKRRPAPTTDEEDADGPNPLPPALERRSGADEEPSAEPVEPAPRRTSTSKTKPKPIARPVDEDSERGDISRVNGPAAAGVLAEATSDALALPPPGSAGQAAEEPAPVRVVVPIAKSEPTPAGPGNLPGPYEAPPRLAAAPPGGTMPPSTPSALMNTPVETSPKPASEPVFSSTEPAKPAEPPARSNDPKDYNPFALVAAAAAAAPATEVNTVARAKLDDRVAGSSATQELEPEEFTDNANAAAVASTTPTNVANPVQAAGGASAKTKWSDIPLDMASAKQGADKLAASKVDGQTQAAATGRTSLASSLMKRLKPGPVEKVQKADDSSVAVCSYDSRLRKINDFRLPDLEGKTVRFQDLNADFVLLDFWGTWCAPCVDSIPHLIELQKKYGPTKFTVVGVACENVAPAQRRAKVEEAARKLGINYPILMSGMDDKPCPVQQKLAIQAMPTMILVDRKGQVLWRSTGATAANESRLDRVLAAQISLSEAGKLRPAALTRGQ